MPEFNRKRQEASYELFEKFMLEDQRQYYQDAVERNRLAASQVNRIRATFALLTGLASALAGLIVLLTPGTCQSTQLLSALSQTGVQVTIDSTPEAFAAPSTPTNGQTSASAAQQTNCGVVNVVVVLMLIIAVVAPALGGAFGTLADLFQWDRLVSIYDTALENLEVADAKSPLTDMEDIEYLASLKAYTEGTLSVMRDETAQWGQVIRTPESIQRFIEREMELAEKNVDPLPDEVRKAISDEMNSLREAAAQTNQRLDDLRALFEKDAGKPSEPTPP